MNMFFVLAAFVAAATFYVHTFVGGPRVALPLLESGALPPASKWLNYYTWHITTWLLAVMAASFAWAAMHNDARDVAALNTMLAAGNCALSIWVALKGSINPFRFPSTSLFALIVIFGVAGVIGAA